LKRKPHVAANSSEKTLRKFSLPSLFSLSLPLSPSLSLSRLHAGILVIDANFDSAPEFRGVS